MPKDSEVITETEDVTDEIESTGEVTSETTIEPAKPAVEDSEVETEVEPKEVEVEVKTSIEPDEKPFSLEDFNKERDGIIGEKAKEKAKATEKTTEKAEDPAKLAGRDYSFVSDAKMVPHLKKMGNEAFNIVKGVFEKNKALEQVNAQLKEQKKSDLPPNYFSNPNAYVLAPEYQTLTTKVQIADKVRQHWVAQEIQIRKTGKYIPLQGLDKDGNLVVGEVKEATDDDEILVKNNIEFTRDQALTQKQKLQTFVDGFQSKYETDANEIKQAEEELYKGFDAPEHPTRKVQDAIRSKLPGSFKESVPASLFVKSMAKAVLDLSTRDVKIKELENEIAKLKGIRKDTQQAPPTKNKFSAAAGAKKVFSVEDFARERNK